MIIAILDSWRLCYYNLMLVKKVCEVSGVLSVGDLLVVHGGQRDGQQCTVMTVAVLLLVAADDRLGGAEARAGALQVLLCFSEWTSERRRCDGAET